MGLPDRVSGWAREAAKRRNARRGVGAGERVELDELVGKYSRYRRVIHDRRLVITDEGAYFVEADGTEATEALPWKEVIAVELARSVTGTCVLDILLQEALWGMRTVSCDFYAAAAEDWEMWTSCLSTLAQGHSFRLEVVDDYAAVTHTSVEGEEMGSQFSTSVRVAADDMRATMNWVRTQWSQMTNAHSAESAKDGIYPTAKCTARSECISTAPTTPTRVFDADATPEALMKAALAISEKGITDSRSTSASDMNSVETSAIAISATAETSI
jgi:hypothetical protein